MQIDSKKYFSVKKTILACLKNKKRATYNDFLNYSKKTIRNFSGSLAWYVEIVKLDLEARGTIKRIPETSPLLFEKT